MCIRDSEISHVTQRHIARLIEAQTDRTPVSVASIIGSIVVALINPTVGMAALSSSTGLLAQAGINFTDVYKRQHLRLRFHKSRQQSTKLLLRT